jgi:hypothetical protein
MMDPTRSREMPSCSAIYLAEIRRSSKITSWIWSLISGVVELRIYQHPGNMTSTGYPLIRQFPPHFPSRASSCAITFQLDSTCFADTRVNSERLGEALISNTDNVTEWNYKMKQLHLQFVHNLFNDSVSVCWYIYAPACWIYVVSWCVIINWRHIYFNDSYVFMTLHYISFCVPVRLMLRACFFSFGTAATQ